MAPAELDGELTPSIDWNARLAAWGIHPGVTPDRRPAGVLRRRGQPAAQTPVPVLQDYLRYHLVDDYAEYLSSAASTPSISSFHGSVMSGQQGAAPALEARAGRGRTTPWAWCSGASSSSSTSRKRPSSATRRWSRRSAAPSTTASSVSTGWARPPRPRRWRSWRRSRPRSAIRTSGRTTRRSWSIATRMRRTCMRGAALAVRQTTCEVRQARSTAPNGT